MATYDAGGLTAAAFSESVELELPALELFFVPNPQPVISAIEKAKAKNFFIDHSLLFSSEF